MKPLKNNKPSLVGLGGQPLETKKTRILVGMPTYRFNVEPQTRQSMTAMLEYMRHEGYAMSVYQADSALVAKGRNDAVVQARELGAEWLMFIDSDMVFEPDHVEMLLKHDLDVVGGLCTKRVPPFSSTIYFRMKDSGKFVPLDSADPNAVVLNSLTPCDATGTAFLLIRMSVFDKIEAPWFAMPPGSSGQIIGEDLYFCNLLRDAGVDVTVDTGVLIGHIGPYAFTYVDRLGYAEIYGNEHRDGTGSAEVEGGVCKDAGAGVSALLRASRAAKALSPESG